jgi:hypothetical protein
MKLMARRVHGVLRKAGRAFAADMADTLGDLTKADEPDDDNRRADHAIAGHDFGDWSGIEDAVAQYAETVFAEAAEQALIRMGVEVTAAVRRELIEVVHEDAVKFAQKRAAEMVKDVTKATRKQVRGAVTSAIKEGWSSRKLAEEIAKSPAFNAARAETIARTELAIANSEGFKQGLEASGVGIQTKEWLIGEDNPCDECQGNADQGPIAYDATFQSGHAWTPAHPNCLPGDARVLAAGISAASKRRYDGNVFIVRTASGKELTCTPNHPILSDGGWVPARLLNVGSNVVAHRGREWESAGGDLEHQDVPPRIEDVAEAFGRSQQVTARPVPLAAEDFHGDGAGSEVAIVWADRALRDRGDASLQQHGGKFPLDWADVQALGLDGGGAGKPLLDSMRAGAGNLMGGLDLARALLGGEFREVQRVRLADASDVNAALPQALGDGHAVRADDAGELIDRLSGQVFADEVIDIEVRSFEGHVFNLETGSGVYVAEGILTHNCVCDVAVTVKE